LIHGEENVEFGCLGRRKKIAIFQSSQSSVTGCLAIVLGQTVPETLIDAFVDQNAHYGTCKQEVFRFFERGNGRFSRDSRKSLEKVFQRFSAFQVVEQRLDRHTRSPKHSRHRKLTRPLTRSGHMLLRSCEVIACLSSYS
jgi:hypothetical protein